LPQQEDSSSAGPVGDLGFVTAVLREHHILPSVFADAEDVYSSTQKKSQELRDKIIKKAIALINIKSSDPSTRVSGLYLLGVIISNATYEMLHKSYEQWCNSLLTILGVKVRFVAGNFSSQAILHFAILMITIEYDNLHFRSHVNSVAE
jgi:hypothetical protein